VSGLERLPVTVSSDHLHAIDVPESFEALGSFVVAITNRGRDAHVHLKLDDVLASVASLDDTNVYVERDATREVEVSVASDVGPATGGLRIETGYGAETVTVEVTVSNETDPGAGVEDRLGAGTPPDTGDADAGGFGWPTPTLPRGWRPVAALSLVALTIAVGTAVAVNDPVVIAGVVVVLVGVVAAAILVAR
jgi:hypothetical protein